MADVAVKRQSTETSESSKAGNQEVASRRSRDPFGFSLAPFEFLHSDPFTTFRRLQDEMDRTFGRFLSRGGSTESAIWAPAIEVAERNGQLQVHAELPGLKPEDVKIEIAHDALVIQGERKSEQQETKGGVYRSERHYGHFYREIQLPEGTNPDAAKAQFRDGVLEVSIPLPEQKTKRRTIPIEAGQTQNQAQK